MLLAKIRNADLFSDHIAIDPVIPVRPKALAHEEWPPDYPGVYAWRLRTIAALESDPDLLESAMAYYTDHPDEFIQHWMDTFDPRKVTGKWMPFVFFARQSEMVQFLEDCRTTSRSGLMEKCRDAGATWVSCAYSVWAFLFVDDMSIGWGSRKESLVDKLGDADSIFEKMRLLLSRLPRIFMPKAWRPREHATYMKLINPDNGATISGEAGDNIGRGGRKTAQPIDTPVLTPDGYRKMGDLQIGDYVVHPSGKPVKVINVIDHGYRDVYRIQLNDGTSTECDIEHLWNVQDKATRKNLARSGKIRGDEWKTLETGTIARNVIHNRDELNYTIPITKPVELKGWTPEQHLIHPYVMGVLLGDGSIKHIDKTPPSFTSIDAEIINEVERLLPPTVKLSYDGNIGYRIIDKELKRGRGKKSLFKTMLHFYSVANLGSHDKFIPDLYKFGPIETRLAILQGLMDTDGYVSKRKDAGKVCFTVSNKRLSDDVKFIVQSLGGVARQTVKKTTHADSHILTIKLPIEFNPFRLKRKAERVGERKKYKISRAIESVEFSRKEQVRCITVDNDDGLYLTNDCIVTHNCYFKDESAHYERPEKIEAALGDNTNVQIDISSVNGLGNVFHRRRESGYDWYPGHDAPDNATLVFIMDWSHHPAKTQEWYDARKAKAVHEGMQHIFAQEVDRDYSAAISNTIIAYEWIQSAVDAHLHIPYLAEIVPPDAWTAGLDVADEGEDRNALTKRQWIILRSCEEWGERDVGVTCRRVLAACRQHRGIKVQYDCIGIGAGVKSEYNRLIDDATITEADLRMVPWNAGAGVVRPYERVIPDDDLTPLNRDMFGNFKAQAWFDVSRRFYKTHRARKEGVIYDPEELISLDSRNPLLHQLMKELAQPTKGESTGLRMIVNKKPNGMKSPNLADSAIEAFFPAPDDGGHALVGSYGGSISKN